MSDALPRELVLARLRKLGIETGVLADGSVRGSISIAGKQFARPEGVRLANRQDFALHGDAHLHFLPPSPLRLLGLLKYVGARDSDHLLRYIEASWNAFVGRTTAALGRARGYFADARLNPESWQIVTHVRSPKAGLLELIYFEEASGPKAALRKVGDRVLEPPIQVSLPTNPPSVSEALKVIFQAANAVAARPPERTARLGPKAHFSAVFSAPLELEETIPPEERIPQDELSGSFVVGSDGFLEDESQDLPEPSLVDEESQVDPDPSERIPVPRKDSPITAVFPPSPFFDDDMTEAPQDAAAPDAIIALPTPIRAQLQAGFHRLELRVTHFDRTGVYGDWLGKRPKDGQLARLVGVAPFSAQVKTAPPGPHGDANLIYRPDPAFAETQDAKGVLVAMRPGPARDRAIMTAIDAGALCLSTNDLLSLSVSCAVLHVRLFVLEPRALGIPRWQELEGPLSLDERGKAVIISDLDIKAVPTWARVVHSQRISEVLRQELGES